MWLRRIGSSTIWKPFVHFGAACLGLGESVILLLFNSDRIALDQAFRIGALLAIAGSLLLSFGMQRVFKSQVANRKSLAGDLRADRAVSAPFGSNVSLCSGISVFRVWSNSMRVEYGLSSRLF